jgi:hypothetical protein
MIYLSVSSAVVSALAAEAKSGTKGQAWQKLYDPTEENGGDLASLFKSKGDGLDRNQVDYWIAARLHHLLIPRHWHALVAKYSTHKGRKVEAIALLRTVVATPAPQLFLFKAVTAWAIPKLPGARPEPVKSVTVDVPLDAPAWRRDALIAAAVSAGKVARRAAESRSADMIVLADSFYDMNTWDLDASPESTRRRWRAGIQSTLDEMVAEALSQAELILRAEGVLDEFAA